MSENSNEKRPHVLQKVAIGGLFLLLAISLFESVLTTSERQNEVELMLSAVLPGVIVDLTNEEREAQHLNTLKRNPLLDEAARLKGMHMKQNNYFAHYSPQGVSPWYWFDVVKYNYLYAGENLAVYFDESEDVVDAWMESPLHKENILKKEYTEIGVAVVEGAYDGYSTYFVVQLFGTPATTQSTELTTNTTNKLSSTEEVSQSVKDVTETVLGETIVQPEEKILEEADGEVLPERTLEEPVVFTEDDPEDSSLETVQEENYSSTVEKREIDNKTVYVTDHASTSTLPAFPASTDSTQSTPNSILMLNVLYSILLLITTGLTVISIVLTERRKQRVQVLYGISLLFASIILALFHTQIVVTTTSLLQ